MNRYIVVNTKAKNSAVWETIGDNYTPSKGEVCIIVPPSDKIDITKDVVSTSNLAFIGHAGRIIKQMFPERSIYEN